ncbi:BON domain-containing protein [Nitrosomonas ureae]|uniref:Hyperosmotically inducible protein n=1 Tax=Nitrosomonas ureae TaxID=44577 RepID=A0A1H9FJD8_9PROT|nr:BON domain-containing protein [Nitrosomonas ureae]SEQ37458.1 hyperosmotically inducible protein [Nitrosomonas ureae]
MKTTDKDIQSILIKRVIVIVGLFAVFGLASCQQEGPAEKMGEKIDRSVENVEHKLEQITEQVGKEINEARKTITNESEESNQYLDDSVITVNVQTAIVNDPLLEVSDIKVTTVNGTVQLSGMVDSQELIDRAAEVAYAQKDVKAVENNLIVKVVLPE